MSPFHSKVILNVPIYFFANVFAYKYFFFQIRLFIRRLSNRKNREIFVLFLKEIDYIVCYNMFVVEKN